MRSKDGQRQWDDSEGDAAAAIQPLIASEQVQALFGRRVLPYAVSVVNAVIVVLALGAEVWLWARIGWLALIGALAVGRYLLARAYFQARPPPPEAPRWGLRYALGIGLNGIAWGIIPLLFSSAESGEERALMSFVLGGMVAGATATASTDPRSFRAFTIPALLPMVLTLAVAGGRVNLAMATMLALFGVAMTILAQDSGRSFAQNARLRLRNERLVQRLAEARDLLERRVQERTAALQASLEERRQAEVGALQAVAARDDFLAVASHELLTPLSALQLQLRLLEQTLITDRGDDRLVRPMGAMTRQVVRMAALVDTVFRVSGLDAGQLVLETRPVDLAAIVKAAVSDLEAAGAVVSPASRVTLRLEEPMNGHWDPTRVEQIVVNLLTNALKYGDGKPVTVALRSDPGDRERVLLTVSDQGRGIPPTEIESIFQKFHRGEAGRQSQGLGLGLFVVRELARAMGGDVTVSSTVRVGSTFSVSLPGRSPKGTPD